MSDVRHQQIETAVQTDVPHVAGNITEEIDEFMPGVQEHYWNIYGRKLEEDVENDYRRLFSAWNTFLHPVQGVQDTSAIISSNVNEDIEEYIPWLEELRGETLVIRWNVCLTIVGFTLYIADLVSDIGTSGYYVSNGQWWRAMLTLAIVYGAVIIHTAVKWNYEEIHCNGEADWLHYVCSLLANWPDVKQYGTLCLLEWKMFKLPTSSAHLVTKWHVRRYRVAYLKFTEGVCEACPQAILQICLLVPDLYGAWTWTDYLRIAGTSVSLCTAGAALVNREKFNRIITYTDVRLCELVVLYVWAVPVTVSRLLSVTLLLSVHSYWALAGVALHLVLYDVYWCITVGVPRILTDVISICLDTLQFCMSPFEIADSITNRRVYYAIHFLVNTAAMVVWALGTPLVSAHPALYTAIICFYAVMFAVGLVDMELHKNYWPESYP